MSSKREIFDGDVSRARMQSEGFGNLFAGAMIGGGIAVGVGVFIYVLMLISYILPPQSKQAEDPTPGSFSAYVVPYEETLA